MDKYGLVGYPLGHSFSRDFFNENSRTKGLTPNMSILRFPLLNAFRKSLRKTQICADST